MDPQADPDTEFIVVSTSDCTDSASYPGAVLPQISGLTNNAKLLIKSFRFLSSRLGTRIAELGTAGTHIPKYSETMGRQIADHRSVTNYNYIINGGRGGSGGEGGQPQAREATEFQTIRLGDIKLIKEIKDIRFGVVGRQTPGANARRVYTAKLEGCKSGHMTVAMYEGDGAEEAWNQHLEKYEAVRWLATILFRIAGVLMENYAGIPISCSFTEW
ncbi:hypothetical protein MSAN_01516600 [Mycena sanguinolenta]|uniref:Uncharacterized protein n=1 Tax=Mycena sanguinolenta TaxID=230812 RepID=A0A8H6Y7G3_9AGAR|nr:hypothetical protein MSAN_01516600 [Mycena sanguinolenta]